jgi:cytochrome P450 family 6
MEWLWIIVQVFLGLSTLIFWLRHRQNYFKRHGIPYIDSLPILGNFFNMKGIYNNVVALYNHPKVKDLPFFGFFIFHKPGLMINDPELIKRITVKEFSSFTDRYASSDTHDTLGLYGLFASNNPAWKTIRGKISPFFSSGKMKMMYYIMDEISSNMIKHVNHRLVDGKAELEMKELAGLYSTDVIASCAFGLEAKSLENPKSEFRKAATSVFEMTLRRSVELASFFMLPQVMKSLGFCMFSKFTSEFINKNMRQVISERKKSGEKRHDLIDTIIEFEKNENVNDEIMFAQAAMFLGAGE